MKGNNKIVLCPAAMMQAMQEWVDNTLTDDVEVTAIEYDSGEHTFVVSVKERPATEAAA